MKIKNKLSGFTLIELIVVITILVILGTIGFLSMRGYVASTRDSVRVTTLANIYKGLIISHIKTGNYPTPEEHTNIVGVSKQGYAGENIIRIIKISGSIKDPLDNTDYLYSVDPTGRKIQLSSFLEENNPALISGIQKPGRSILSPYSLFSFHSEKSLTPFFIHQAFALNTSGTDYTNRYIYSVGDRVGMILDTVTKAPINITISTGSLDLANSTNTGTYTAVFSNTLANSGTISGTGQSLLTNISIIQNSCVLGTTVVISGGQLNAYKTNSVAYDQACIPIARSCNNGILSGGTEYQYDTCAPASALSCTATTHNGYTIPEIAHTITQNITKAISLGTSHINATCMNGVLSYGAETIDCGSNVREGDSCVADKCTGDAPDWSLSNGIQKYNIAWTHNTSAGQCTFVCQAAYYWNSPICQAASIGYKVPSSGQTTQTPCNSNTEYQDTAGQTTCKTVSSGYYSTPIGYLPHTTQIECEANNYCVNGVKTACAPGYSSPIGSTTPAACTLNSYTVSGNFTSTANGATVNICGKTTTVDVSGNFSVTANYNTNCANVTVTKAGYTCTTTTNGPPSLTSNTTNVAGSCSINTYAIALDANGGTLGTASVTASYNTAMPTLATAPTRTGYSFNGYFSATTGGTKYYNADKTSAITYPLTTSTTLYAQWTINNYAVTFNANGGDTPIPTTKSVTYNTAVGALATISKTGYTFNGWFTATTGGTAITTATVITGDITWYAQWTVYTCATNPSFTNIGALTLGTPISIGQSWSYNAANTGPCTYACINGYTGNGCATPPPFPCGTTVSAGGYTYSTILGPDGKCWTSQNMKHLSAAGNSWNYGDANPNLATNSNGTIYGRLYTWYATMGLPEGSTATTEDTTKSVCSQLGTGWALPTNVQWSTLQTAGATGWTGNKLSGIVSNLSGRRLTDGSFSLRGTRGYWWTPTLFSASTPWYRFLDSGDASIYASGDIKTTAISIICLKNY